jgi:hypothetical protein
MMRKCTTHNERFHASGGVCPQKHLWEFGSLSPARTFVPPRLREATTTLAATRGLNFLYATFIYLVFGLLQVWTGYRYWKTVRRVRL